MKQIVILVSLHSFATLRHGRQVFVEIALTDIRTAAHFQFPRVSPMNDALGLLLYHGSALIPIGYFLATAFRVTPAPTPQA